MAVNLSSLAGAAAQFFDNNGVPLAGGLIYTYTAGTTTPATTYTSSTGLNAHANPIVLDAAGRIATGEVWLTTGVDYKFLVKTSANVQLGSYDNIPSINDFTSIYADLANTTNVALGDALIGFRQSNAAGNLSGATGRTVHQKLQESVSVKDFGADSTGATSCSTIFATANASGAGSLVIPAGTYLISTNVTFTTPVIMNAGAVINVPTGITLTFNKGFSAGIGKAFNTTGTGNVVFNFQFFSVGYPEWWGASTGNAAFDNTAALTACVVACPITQLQAADYWIFGTWKIQTRNAIVRGVNTYAPDRFTRVLTTSSTADVIFVGLDGDPGSVNAMLIGVQISGIYVTRSVPVTPPVSEIDGAAGFRFRYVLCCKAFDLKSDESTLGFAFESQVSSYYYNLRSFRSASGSTPVNDFFWGFACFGTGPYKLQSIFWQDCNAGVGGAPALTNSIGYAIAGSYTDCSFLRVESTACDVGFFHDQSTETLPSIDNHLIGGIFDQNKIRGVFFENLVAQSMTSVMDTYSVTGNFASAISNFEVRDCAGQVSFVNCQATGRIGGVSLGLLIKNSKNVSSRNNMWCDLQRPIGLISASNCVIEDSIYNKNVVCTQGAIELTASSRNSIATLIYGDAANVYPTGFGGVRMNGTACTFNEVNCTGIDPSGLQTANQKLLYNGIAVTVTGTFGTNNLASGIMT